MKAIIIEMYAKFKKKMNWAGNLQKEKTRKLFRKYDNAMSNFHHNGDHGQFELKPQNGLGICFSCNDSTLFQLHFLYNAFIQSFNNHHVLFLFVIFVSVQF